MLAGVCPAHRRVGGDVVVEWHSNDASPDQAVTRSSFALLERHVIAQAALQENHRGRMRYRTFGRTGWQVSEIGYGMWGIGGWTGSDDEESLRALDRGFALGCNFFDTAWVYGLGKSETLLGQALRNNRASPPVYV